MYYILDDKKNAIPVDFDTYLKMTVDMDVFHVDFTVLEAYEISTVFLGLDHSHGFCKSPLLFETMVFSDNDDSNEYYQTRCSTWKEAEIMHENAVKWVKNGFKNNITQNEHAKMD